MSVLRSLLLVAVCFSCTMACTIAMAQASPKCQVQPQTLAAMHNCYRPLLVFSPAGNDPRLRQQGRILDTGADDMMDRFVMFTPILPDTKKFSAPLDRPLYTPLDTPYVVLSPYEMEAIRTRFHIPASSFVVLLLGEDGSEKLRSESPVGLTRLNALIDAMPSRKIEMRRPHAN